MSEADSPGAPRSWRDDPAWPDVDVVMPIRNEAAGLGDAVRSVIAQEYPGDLRVVLAVAPSDDGTEECARELAATHADVDTVENPAGVTPAGLNAAIRAGSAPVVVRVDGHSTLPDDYVRTAVEALRSTGAGNVGGRQVPMPQTPFEEAVAAATTSWLGTGGAAYRVGSCAGPTDTVYLGVFDRAAIEDVGLFDEQLIRNQDYELNIRLRDAGEIVWFDPALWVGYRPRGSWTALARQYFEYGRWKAVVLRMHPTSARLRQLAAPLGVATITTATILAVRRPKLLAVPLTYFAALTLTVRSAPRLRRRFRTAACLAVIHGCWTAGLVRGSCRDATRG